MSPKTKTQARWYLASIALTDAYTDFILSRQAKNCTPATLEFYKYTAGVFLSWAEAQGITAPEEVTARVVRQYLAGLKEKGKADRTLHANARAIKTLLRFWHKEKYIPELVTFDMPKIEKKRLPRLTFDELQQVAKACNVRDRAILLFMADCGIRREEARLLNWSDVDMKTGAVYIARGKGGKPRITRIGATARRALLAYRRSLADRDGILFQTVSGTRFTGTGLLLIYRRLSERTGIHCTPHAMRRTFVILAHRSGMRDIDLMGLLGQTTLEMVDYYLSLEDEDLLQAHKDHSPIDRLK